MTDMMRATMVRGAGGPDVLDVVEVPRPMPGRGQVLVRVHAAGINRPDVMQREGNYPPPPGASDILGLEMAGVVEELGEGTSRFAVGDRVMALVPSGGYGEWCAVHETNALPVPEGLSIIEAGGIPETYFTVWSNVFQRAGLKKGETILIHGGTSGIGTTTILLAKALGCRVIVTCGSDEKCEAAKGNGADVAINYKTSDFVDEAKKATGGDGPDVILDMVGGDYMQRNIEAVASDGRIAQIAFQRPPKAEMNMLQMLTKRLTWTGSTLRARSVQMKAELAAALEEHVLPLLAKRVAVPVIDSTFPLADVRGAHARMDSGEHVGKIVLTMTEDAE